MHTTQSARDLPRFFGAGDAEAAEAHRTRPREDYLRLIGLLPRSRKEA